MHRRNSGARVGPMPDGVTSYNRLSSFENEDNVTLVEF